MHLVPFIRRFCKLRKVPYGYHCPRSVTTQLAGKGVVSFSTLSEGSRADSPSPPCSPLLNEGAMSNGTASSRSLIASCASDSDQETEGNVSVLMA